MNTSCGQARSIQKALGRFKRRVRLVPPVTNGLRVCIVGIAVAISTVSGIAWAQDDEPAREAYIPHPEFRAHHDHDRLTVEGVTLIRVLRADHTEALVA